MGKQKSNYLYHCKKGKGLDRPRGFREVKARRFHDHGTGCW